jgi:protein-arginine kinase activator protein McsA
MEMIEQDLQTHIMDKIAYHEELRDKYEAVEEYEKCSYHRDEIKRLKKMIAE